MASLTQWTQVWAGSRRQWRTGKPGVLQSVGSQGGKTWLSNWTTTLIGSEPKKRGERWSSFLLSFKIHYNSGPKALWKQNIPFLSKCFKKNFTAKKDLSGSFAQQHLLHGTDLEVSTLETSGLIVHLMFTWLGVTRTSPSSWESPGGNKSTLGGKGPHLRSTAGSKGQRPTCCLVKSHVHLHYRKTPSCNLFFPGVEDESASWISVGKSHPPHNNENNYDFILCTFPA